VIRAYTRERLQHFLIWWGIDTVIVCGLVYWADVTAWRGLACAVIWNVAGYAQGLRARRMDVPRG
jgi:hypothetical protein